MIMDPLRSATAMLIRLALLSSIWLITMISLGFAHEIRPAIADVTLSDTRIELDIRLTAEPLVAGINLEGLADTDEAPEAEINDQLRALSPDVMATEFREAWPSLREGFVVKAGETAIRLELQDISVEDLENVELPRDTTLRLSGELPGDDSTVQIGWDAAYGPLIVRQAAGGDDAYAGYLESGALSDPLPRVGAATESAVAVFLRYISVGFDHIIPKGLDHILFVLGLFFLALQLRPLITQVTVFTIAHTITLALASLGYVTVNPAIVEPLIAASIVYVAIENIFTNRITWWRPVVIFGFGLLHGLGFASVLGEFGLAPGRFVAGLIGFNIGVEIGQLTVIGLAYLAVGHWFGAKPWYRARISILASILIALVGAYWAVERVFF